MRKFLLLIFWLFFLSDSYAVATIKEVNYFSSLRSNETNVRAGPGQQYPIKFTFKLKGIPVQVISEYDNWNEIKDYDGQSGWVMQSLLTKKRTLIVQTTKNFIKLHAKNHENSRVLLHLENNVILEYIKCVENWCAVKIVNKKGWVERSDIFGDD